MLRNYFLVALRNFWRNKVFSLINILGLSIGISASLVIFLLVHHEFTFDRFEPARDRIYRVGAEEWWPGSNSFNHSGCLPAPVGPAIEKDLTGFELVVPFTTLDNTRITIPKTGSGRLTVLKEQKDLIFTDARYFDLLGYTWLSGSPKTALSEPYQIVLTEKNAALYYPGLAYNDILGKTLLLDDTVQTTVTGIVRDLKDNTDFYFGAFISLPTLGTSRLKPQWRDSWNSVTSADQLFVRLSPGTTPAALTPRLTRLYKTHADPRNESKSYIVLQPLADLHFDSVYFGFDEGRQAHKPTLYGLLAVATILLLLACINFVNLTTAQATQRAKEIGIRKTMGSQRGQLAFQFLQETFLLTVMATLLSIGFTPLLIKVFGDFIPADFHVNLIRQPVILLFLLGLITAVSLLSGFYPALIMSAFNPISALKYQFQRKGSATRSAWFRKSLTVSQFVIAQVFIIATILVTRQINYALNLDMGFKKDAILYFNTNRHRNKLQRDALVSQLRAIPGIEGISVASDPPTANGEWSSTLSFNDGKKDIKMDVQIKKGDSNYLRLFKLHLLAGVPPRQSDTTTGVVINQTFAAILGCRDPKDAVGKTLNWHNMTPIVGVLADFHQKSIHTPIQPILIANGTNNTNCINIALPSGPGASAGWPAIISKVGKAFRSIYPDDDFDYKFVDETIAKFYTAEKNTARLLAWATGLAIFISCLGLLGLVIYITNRRTKEIGIRKVIGASVSQLIVLLSRDFIRLVGLAILIALPISWWGSHKWLGNFAYQTRLSWWIFAAGGLVLLLIAMVILCVRTFQAAIANPVESLRSE